MAAYTEFCCRSGGSNLNAGTRTGNATEPGVAANLTYASGTWVSATRVFTVASGDPIADGVAVGDYASVYPDGSTVGVFIGYVSARTTTTITIHATNNAGVSPTDGTNTRTLKIGGAWQGPNGASKFPFTLTNLPNLFAIGTTRINLKNDQTYSVTASVYVDAQNLHLFVSGYTTAYGDYGRATIDGGTTGASYAILEFASASRVTASDLILQNNGATGSSYAYYHVWQSHRMVVHDVRGVGFYGGYLTECEAYNCNQSNTTNLGGFYGCTTVINCKAHDNAGSLSDGFGGCVTHVNCIADSNGRKGFRLDNTHNTLIGCESYNNSSDGLSCLGGSGTHGILLRNCNFVKNGGYGINSAGAFYVGEMVNCGFGSGSQANVSGVMNTNFGNSFREIGRVTYAADVTPWVDPANGDFRISLAAAKGTGRGNFTQTAPGYGGTVAYPDTGAAQHLDSGGGGGGRLVGSSVLIS